MPLVGGDQQNAYSGNRGAGRREVVEIEKVTLSDAVVVFFARAKAFIPASPRAAFEAAWRDCLPKRT
jgi:hypothetical protein